MTGQQSATEMKKPKLLFGQIRERDDEYVDEAFVVIKLTNNSYVAVKLSDDGEHGPIRECEHFEEVFKVVNKRIFAEYCTIEGFMEAFPNLLKKRGNIVEPAFFSLFNKIVESVLNDKGSFNRGKNNENAQIDVDIYSVTFHLKGEVVECWYNDRNKNKTGNSVEIPLTVFLANNITKDVTEKIVENMKKKKYSMASFGRSKMRNADDDFSNARNVHCRKTNRVLSEREAENEFRLPIVEPNTVSLYEFFS
jgi:hypothetical protein